MYLAQLILNPMNKAVRRDVTAQYELHRTLSRMYPHPEKDTSENDERTPDRFTFMFRFEEPDYKSGRLLVLAQSVEHPPNFDALPIDYSLDRSVKFVSDDFLISSVKAGKRFSFRLRANTTTKREGHRFAVRKEHERIDWLARKGERCGFSLLQVNAHNITTGNLQSTRKFAGSVPENDVKGRIFQVGALFDGVLQVTDAEKFVYCLINGIGQGKAFGFGLLSIAEYGE